MIWIHLCVIVSQGTKYNSDFSREKVIEPFLCFSIKILLQNFFCFISLKKIEEAGASDVGGNICSSLTLTFGCYGSPSFLKNKVKKKLGYR